MKQYIVDKKREIEGVELVPRDLEIGKTREFVITIIGPRRSGKTFFLYDIIKRLNLEEKDYVFVNFEDDEVKSLKREEKTKFIDYHRELYGTGPKFIFLDEIQNLERWDSFLYSLVEKKKYHIFATGSSSRLLSKEIATQLRGRAISVAVFPFSFKEFLRVKNFELRLPLSSKDISKVKHFLLNYIDTGGFPQVVLNKIGKKEFFREYLNVVLYRDLVERFKIENIDAMRFLMLSIVQSNAKEFSLNRTYKQIKEKIPVGNKTLYMYSKLLEESIFCFYLYRFNWSLKKALLTIPKVYVVDPGIYTHYFGREIGKLIENVVFLELKKKELRNDIELFYFKDQKCEVDFVTKENNRVKQLIQVAYASSLDEIDKREIRALLHAKELFKEHKPELLVITWDYEDEKELSWFGKKGKIKFIPLWKWLINI